MRSFAEARQAAPGAHRRAACLSPMAIASPFRPPNRSAPRRAKNANPPSNRCVTVRANRLLQLEPEKAAGGTSPQTTTHQSWYPPSSPWHAAGHFTCTNQSGKARLRGLCAMPAVRRHHYICLGERGAADWSTRVRFFQSPDVAVTKIWRRKPQVKTRVPTVAAVASAKITCNKGKAQAAQRQSMQR